MHLIRKAGKLVLALGAGLGAVLSASAQAQVEQSQVSGSTSAQRATSFSIPSQSLAAALTQFGRQSGMQVSVHSDVLGGLSTQGVSGVMTAGQALTQLLSGSGLIFTFSGNTVVVQKPSQSGVPGAVQLDPVQVQGAFPVPSQAMIDNLPPPYAGGQVATGGQLGLLGNRGVMDTPFNQTNYTAKKAQDQQARTVRDVFADDPSVRSWARDGGPGSNNVWVRGFNVTTQNTAYGGLYGVLPTFTIMPEIAERIELLKGPSAMLNGIAPNNQSMGGTINVQPKRAPEQDLTQVTANYLSTSQFGGHVDVARRFGPDKEVGVRFNGVLRGGNTEVENNFDQRSLALLGLDYRGEHVRLSADLGYQYQYWGGLNSYLGVNTGVPLPSAPNARKNLGQPWGYQEHKDLFGVVRAEVDMTERMTAYIAFGAHDFRWQSLFPSSVVADNYNGAATASAPFLNSQYTTTVSGNAGIRAFVDTGPIHHEISLTGSTFATWGGFGSVGSTAFATNFYNPTTIARPNLAMPAANKNLTQNFSSFGIADTLSGADKRIQLTAGVRFQQVTAVNFNTVSGVRTSGYDESAVSPSVALIFKPWQNVSVYGNWIQGLQQGSIVPAGFVNAGEVFPPFKTTQYEAGVKVDWGKFTTTASVFQISQPSVLTNVAQNTQYLGGEQRNQGLELQVFGEPIEGVRLLGGVMFLNGILTKTQGGATDGWTAPFAPNFSLNLGGEWDVPFVPGLTLNGRVIYTSSQYIDATWPRRSLPDWTRLDAGVRYAFANPAAKGKPLVARFNVENVLDANYWAGGAGVTFLQLGAPQTFRVALSADF